MIRQFCETALWLDQGEVMLHGRPDEVLPAYSGSPARPTHG
jgi:ABC-type polysaccharide/polyol phosphate transport system ATPase subunit